MTRDRTKEMIEREAHAARDLLTSLASDDEDLSRDMVEGETSFFEAIGIAIEEMDECEAIAAGCKDRIDVFTARKHRAEGRRDRIRALIEQAMSYVDIPTVPLATATLSIKRVPPKPIIENEAEIPAEFWISKPALDKTALNEAAKTRTIPGVTMSNGGVSLQIRRK